MACSDENLFFTNQLPSHVSVLTTKPSQYLRQLTSHAQLWSQWMHWNAWTRTNTSRVVAFLLKKRSWHDHWDVNPQQNLQFLSQLLTELAALLSLSRLLTCHAAVGSDDFKRRSSASLSHPSKSMSISCGKIWCVTRWPFHELHCHYFITCRFWKYNSAQLNTR